ncbi:hypothetical protein LTR53_013791 [Teratosphaeriaceae sp. CCFEE 6253]|nr:hypothetical protein LTR53_013791 [Teratosphaeriaceae sp. CCFEE 6253]
MKDESSITATAEAIATRSRNVDWYYKDLPDVYPAARELLEQYSGIPPADVKEHIIGIREKAWDIFPYPCVGGFRFLDSTLSTLPQYPEVLSRVKSGSKLLDLGCFFGQELRKLIYDGAPSEALYGTDLRPEFFELGYKLFRDRGRNQATFFAADIFAPSPQLDALRGTLDVIYAGAFFHLFDRPQQLQIAHRVVGLLAPRPGSLMLGRQVRQLEPGSYEHLTDSGGWVYRHNEQSWRELWEEVGRETGSTWEVSVDLYEISGGENPADTIRLMHFCVRRK